MIATLRTRLPTVGDEALAQLQASSLLTWFRCSNDLASCEQQVVLILDDYHLIEEPAIHTSLSFLLDHDIRVGSVR